MPDVLYEKHPEDHYALLTMNRPEKLNAMGGKMYEEMQAAVWDLANDREIYVGILTGAGRAFCSGADLVEWSGRDTDVAKVEEQFARGELTPEERAVEIYRVRTRGSGGDVRKSLYPFSLCPKPIIAAINGPCVAGGTEWAIDCDLRIMSPNAYMGLFEVKRGLLPGSGIHVLSRIVPYGEAMWVLLTGERIPPERCLRMGLVQEVVEPERLLPRAIEIAKLISANAPISVQATKAIAMMWRNYGMEEHYLGSAWVSRWQANSEDAREGPLAFAEKRPAQWQNR